MTAHLKGTADKHQHNGQHQADVNDNTPIAIEVFSIKDGTSCFLRTLSPSYGGIMTHYFKGKGSRYCAGPECMYLCGKLEKTWKGYCAVEVWLPHAKKYRPFVLELTERLEQDMRGLYERGQVWECYKQSPIGEKKQPVQGKLQPAQVVKHLPPEFDWQSVVKNLYHVPKMDFSIRNPLAPRVILTDSQDEQPLGLQTEEYKPVTPEEWEEIKQRSKAFNAAKTTPTERKKPR